MFTSRTISYLSMWKMRRVGGERNWYREVSHSLKTSHPMQKKITFKNKNLRKNKFYEVTELVDDALRLWFKQERLRGIPISDFVLKKKGLMLYSKIETGNDFPASYGWLYHGVCFIEVSGKKLADPATVKDFLQTFLKYIDHKSEHYCWNWTVFQAFTQENAQKISVLDDKMSKVRLILVLYSNATEIHKLNFFGI